MLKSAPNCPARFGYIKYNAPATLAVADNPYTANIDLRRKRRRDSRCFAISAASAPPPCKTSYCCGVMGGVLILIGVLSIYSGVHRSKYIAFHGQTHTQPGPRKKLPASVMKAQNTANMVKVTIAILRSA